MRRETRELPADANPLGYYGLPILKRPLWKWEIAAYFFLEGISAGTYLLCAMAEWANGAEVANRRGLALLIKRARYVAFATLLPCPPLLIADLGRPERFHHMLRIFKRTSPMNHGAWALTGYGFFSFACAFISSRFVAVLGLPFAFTMVSYPGVLLETTSIPVWAKTNFLGPLFAASSIGSGAAAMTLLSYNSDDRKLEHALMHVEDLAAAAEIAAVGIYLTKSTRAARPLLRGKQSSLFLWGALVAGIALPLVLRRSKNKRLRSIAAPSLTLAGGFALKWAVTYAGQESARDVEMAVHNSPSKDGQPFWGSGR